MAFDLEEAQFSEIIQFEHSAQSDPMVADSHNFIHAIAVTVWGWGDPHDRKLYRKSVRNISRYETSLHRKKIGGIQKRERSIGVTLYVGSFAAI